MSDTFFATARPPPSLAASRERLVEFVGRECSVPIVCVTSGGTTVPLERNTVRFIDNFSTGNRGASSAERFLEEGYAVIFLHREQSAFPFARKLVPPSISPMDWLMQAGSVGRAQADAASQFSRHAPRLLAVSFTTVFDYLFLLREAACAMAPVGDRALIYLAAAVSDFYVPEEEMAEHKIQSSTGTAEHVPGGLVVKLWPVPKLLGSIKAAWATGAFLVSFKLETNRSILLAKAAASIAKYDVDVVCANQLQSYKTEVTLVTRSGEAVPSCVSVRGDEMEVPHVSGITAQTLQVEPPVEMEDELVAELVRRHKAFRGATDTDPHNGGGKRQRS